jgi:hypothetical protein
VACAGGRAIGGDALAMQVHACMTVKALTDSDQRQGRARRNSAFCQLLRRRDDKVGWSALRLQGLGQPASAQVDSVVRS